MCSDKGRCITESAVNQPVTTPAPSKGVPRVAPLSIDFGTTLTTTTFTISNAGGEPFDFRLLSNNAAFSAQPFEGRVSGQPITIAVTLDRSQLAGDSSGSIALNTTAGSRRVALVSSLPLDGLWSGSFDVNSPVELGTHLALFNLGADGGFIDGVVHGERSPVWPVNAHVTGSLGTGDDAGVSLTFRIVAPQGTAANPAIPGTIERIVTISGQQTGTGTITGSFVETLHGVAGAQVEISGVVALRRLGAAQPVSAVADSTTTVGPVADAFVDDLGAPRAAYQACLSCPSGACSGDALSNGLGFFNYAPPGSPKAAMIFYSEFQPNSTTPFAGADRCVAPSSAADVSYCQTRRLYDPFYIRCAQYWYAKAIRNGQTAASTNFLDTLEITADAALYEGNAAIAAAFDDWYLSGASLSQQGAILARAQTKLLSGLYSNSAATPISVVDPAIASYVVKFDQTMLANNFATTTSDQDFHGAGEQLRRSILTINAFLFAADQRAFIARKANNNADATQRLGESAVTGYLAFAGIAGAIAKSPNTWTTETAAFRTQWHQLLTDLVEISDGRNPLGYLPNYVPFLWNKDSQGTNYQQIKALADNSLTQWRTTHDAASGALRQFESSTTALNSELNQLSSGLGAQLQEVCGAGVSGLTACGGDYGGSNASLIAQAKLDLSNSITRAQEIATQIGNVFEEIKIEESRAAQVAGVHKNNAMLIRNTGETVALDDVHIAKVNQTQQVIGDVVAAASAAVGSSPWGAAGNLGIGAAHAIADYLLDDEKISVERDKAAAQTDEQSQLEFSVSTVELINSAATVKIKLLQLNALYIEKDLAIANIAQSNGRLNALYGRAQALVDDIARGSALAQNQGRQALHARIFANHAAQLAANDQRSAVSWAYLATRALEYQLNVSLDQTGLWAARSPLDLSSYLQNVLANAAGLAGSAQTRVDIISLRDKIFGFNTPIKDVTNGAIITPQQRFRQYVMSPKNRDANGNFHIQFLTNDDGNPIFSSLLASDRIRSIKMNLVGDNLGVGVTTAQLQLIHGGTSYLRSRTRDLSGSAPLKAYDVSGKSNRPTLAIIQAGINAPSSNPQTPENIELQERAVLAGPWQLIIDQSSSTPANANLNLAGLDDIEFIVTHDSYTIQ